MAKLNAMKLILLYKHLKKESVKLLSQGLIDEYFFVIQRLEMVEKKMNRQLLLN
jgi:hypothetical protein